MSNNQQIFVIPPQSGSFLILKKGQFLKVTDPRGQQVSDLFCVDLHDTADALSPGRSIDYNDTIFLTTGSILYSNRSRPMLEIVSDDCGRHDFLLTPCSLAMFQIVAGNSSYHPSCHENLAKALFQVGLTPDQITGSFNIFMNVAVSSDEKGRIEIKTPQSNAGDSIVLKACMDLAVGLTACSHEETNNGICKPIHYEIY
jgi:uncharacterized protein YcgI (DUF1989 family)